ncbi:pentaheme c-type cytochrome TorC [Neptunomonas sp. XY-337]|uniref:pentaheme c-type cytochrome TorC n=1 Tax=Neptunomonas sp. XY-337 TaxID=2561897 RepID=UPI0010AA7A4A|nr:pentaheme c-type cytochrome TorC [Neptunomonas sp. XY-337]
MKRFMKKAWKVIRSPSAHMSLGVLTLGGFAAGVIFWGAFNTGLEATNTEEFCIGCHEMADNVYVELQDTVHWSNHSGVRATCPDCHVPHKWTDKIARKMQASKEVWGAMFGTISTREKFLEKRLELAQHEWQRFSANNSLECRNCHDYKSMNFDLMSEKAKIQMRRAAERDQSCIDCHKGIAHQLPDMLGGASDAFAQLEQGASVSSFEVGKTYFSVRQLPLFEDDALQTDAGHLNPVTAVKVIEVHDEKLLVELSGWRKTKGFGRVINEDFGFNIVSGLLTKEAAQNDERMETFESQVDELTGLTWQRVNVRLWMKPNALAASTEPLWDYAKETYQSSCSVCHTQPDEDHFDANTWPGMFNGMLSFVNLDGDTQALVLKYLQKHSSDFSDKSH